MPDISADFLQPISRRIAYALLGVALALGAPAGLLLVRLLANDDVSLSWMEREIANEIVTYVYVAVSTTIVFAVFGWLLGWQADRLIELSTTDQLTELLNTRGFHQRFSHELARARRSRQPLSLVVLDLDGLKRINDHHGHEVGDRAIRAVAEAIRDTFRITDIGARGGGDEFGLLAPNTAGDAAATLAERIRTRATEARSPLTQLAASVSLGVATFDPAHDMRIDTTALMRAADEALYSAKRAGGNRVNAARVAKTV